MCLPGAISLCKPRPLARRCSMLQEGPASSQCWVPLHVFESSLDIFKADTVHCPGGCRLTLLGLVLSGPGSAGSTNGVSLVTVNSNARLEARGCTFRDNYAGARVSWWHSAHLQMCMVQLAMAVVSPVLGTSLLQIAPSPTWEHRWVHREKRSI